MRSHTIITRLISSLKSIIPGRLLILYNRLISRSIIRRRVGKWFDVDWKTKAATASISEWQKVYDRSWENWSEQDLTPYDLQCISELVPENASILDAGCGDGYLLDALRDKGTRKTGLDISSVALSQARIRLGVEFPCVQGSVENLPFANKCFDIVISAHTLEHVNNFEQSIEELARIAKTKLIVLVPVQEYKTYTEDYHLQFFPSGKVLLDRTGLPNAVCRRYSTPSGYGKFSGDVLLLTANFS